MVMNESSLRRVRKELLFCRGSGGGGVGKADFMDGREVCTVWILTKLAPRDSNCQGTLTVHPCSA